MTRPLPFPNADYDDLDFCVMDKEFNKYDEEVIRPLEAAIKNGLIYTDKAMDHGTVSRLAVIGDLSKVDYNAGTQELTLTLPTSSGGSGAAQFVELTDTPYSYRDQKSKILAVKCDESGLEFVDAPNVTELGEYKRKATKITTQNRPVGISGIYQVNSSDISWGTSINNNFDLYITVIASPTYAEMQIAYHQNVIRHRYWVENIKRWTLWENGDFIGLQDTPHSYKGCAGKTVKVNDSETGLTFDMASFIDLKGTPARWPTEEEMIHPLSKQKVDFHFVVREDGIHFYNPITKIDIPPK